jgi:hypothetical protein
MSADILKAPCWEVIHPGDASCVHFTARHLVDVCKNGVRLYGPLFLVMALVKHRKQPANILRTVPMNVLRSTAFLSTKISSSQTGAGPLFNNTPIFLAPT